MNVCFITGNPHKIREAEQILNTKLRVENIDLDEIQEIDAFRVSEQKAMQAFELLKKPVVVWDQSLYIDCLNGFPGPLVKWFWKTVTLEKICEIAHKLQDKNISAITMLTYYDGKIMEHFVGEIKGKIPSKPRGKKGFAWDPVFIPDGDDKTFAEMTSEEKNSISMHRIALKKLKRFLDNRAEA
jgi:non-canonical purine NTP pyrophosphatase (RdgB/HAM1 family)